ncbi:MAG TPA: hypothetical protein VGB20_07265 [bacterium]
MAFLARDLSPDTYVNIMSQYRPAARAAEYPELARRITSREYRRTCELAREAGLRRFDHTHPDTLLP